MKATERKFSGFYKISEVSCKKLFRSISSRYYFKYKGPEGHIISITNRCNNRCNYCIVSAKKNSFAMNKKTGKKIINFIFTIPLNSYYIEFTGGEPFLNFDTLKETIEYANYKSTKLNKKVHFSIVSNLNWLTDQHIKLILKHKITICTSLDGPKELHNKNRSNSYLNVISNIKKLNYYANKGFIEPPNIITTITKDSLKFHKEIINQYLELDIKRIQLGFIEPYGKAKKKWVKLGYTYNEYLNFYEKALEYIIDINTKKNILVYEKGAYLLLNDILKLKKPKQRSIDIYHRLAYDVNGNIYPSDEARIIGENRDKSFLIGNVKSITNFQKLIKKEKTQKIMINNFQDFTRPLCARCNYCVYCKVGEYYNYITQNSFYGNMITNDRCKLMKGIFDILFKMIKKPKYLKVFNNWIENYK